MKVTQLEEANNLSWLAHIEQVCKLRDCWGVVVDPVPANQSALLDTLPSVPTRAVLTATMTYPSATVEEKKSAGDLLGALQWRRKDQMAQAILKLNLEGGKQDALKECKSAHEVYRQVKDAFTSRGLSGRIEMRRRLCTLRKGNKEAMTSYINRASMLRVDMSRIGIGTPKEELVAALLAGLPAAYAATVELLEYHGPEDTAGVSRRLLAVEQKHQRMEREEDEATALAASAPATAASMPSTHPLPPTVPVYDPSMRFPPLFGPSGGPPPVAPPMQPHRYHRMVDGAGRPVRTCWGCGQSGHVQWQCATRPPPPPLRPPGRSTGPPGVPL